MQRHIRCGLAMALAAWLTTWPAFPGQVAAQSTGNEIAILQIKVTEGEGAVHTVNTRSQAPLSVSVTDETGRPVAGVAVSFRLPDEGPGGVFNSGLKSEVVITATDGKASIYGIRWNATPGPVQVRITAARGSARAGVVMSQYLSESATAAPAKQTGVPVQRVAKSSGGSKGKWIALASIAAGAAVGGLAATVAGSKGGSTGASSGAATAPPPATQPSVSIGQPTIVVGRP